MVLCVLQTSKHWGYSFNLHVTPGLLIFEDNNKSILKLLCCQEAQYFEYFSGVQTKKLSASLFFTIILFFNFIPFLFIKQGKADRPQQY